MALNTLQARAVVTMLQNGISGGRAFAYKTDRWAKHPSSSVSDSRVELAPADAEVLVHAGLLSEVTSGTVGYNLTPEGVAFAYPHVEMEHLNLEECLRFILDLDYFVPDDRIDGQTAIPAIYVPGTSRLVLVLGENAGGKSFFRRLVSLATSAGGRDNKAGPFPVREMIHLSMQGRTMGGPVRGFVYGTENWQSTGENSANTVHTGIRTVNNRTHTSIIYWDEPDIGMAAAAAAGTGIAIREFVDSASPLVQGVFITSHSEPLVRQLAELDPHYLYLGNADGPATLEDWFDAQRNPVPVSPKELMERSRNRYQLIQKILKK